MTFLFTLFYRKKIIYPGYISNILNLCSYLYKTPFKKERVIIVYESTLLIINSLNRYLFKKPLFFKNQSKSTTQDFVWKLN